ncbi:oligosaccharide flippase family protein [Virgibacillus natechei]
MKDTLKNKSITGVKWLSINTAFNSILNPIFYILLAVLLTPSEFAYLAVITLIYRVAPILAKFGLEEAYIQERKVNRYQASSLVFLTLILSSLIAVLLFILSPLIESIYNLENLSLFINLLTIAIMAEGVESVFKSSFRKFFFFKEWSIFSMMKMSIKIISTIIFILLGYGVIAIVLGIVISSVFSLILFTITSFTRVGLKINFYFNIKQISSFINFGYPVTGKRFFDIISQRFDEIIIGAFLSTEILGVYFFGKNLIMQLKTAITQSFSMILLPLYSELKGSLQTLKKAYFTITGYTAIVALPVLAGISLTADLFVPVFFGDKWMESVIVIQILSIAMIFPIVTANNAASLLYSLKSPLLVLKIETITAVIYLSLLGFFVMHGGTKGALVLFSIFLFFKSITLQYFVNKKLGSNLRLYIYNLRPIFASLITMILMILLVRNYIIADWNDTVKLISIILLGSTTYVIGELLFDRNSTVKLFKMLFKNSKTSKK